MIGTWELPQSVVLDLYFVAGNKRCSPKKLNGPQKTTKGKPKSWGYSEDFALLI